jgi:hypothetical protein
MGRENTIRTGISIPNKMLDMASNAYNSITRHHKANSYGLVRAVNPTTRQIIYSPISNNIPLAKQGIAIPLSTNFIKLPEPNNIVRIIIGPNTDTSVANVPGSNTVYYDPNPIGVWQTVDNNKINPGPTLDQKAKEISVNPKDLKQVTLGIPHNKPSNLSTSKAGPKPTHNYIISKPIASNNTFAIIVGGTPSSSYGATYMKKQAETAGIISNKNIIFSDFENSTESLMNAVRDKFPEASFTSFSGFSRGGQNACGEIGNFSFIGLIDPSLTINANVTDNSVYMMYNPNNWDNSYPQLADRQRAIGPKMGGRATQLNKIHSQFPVLFFQTYGNKL